MPQDSDWKGRFQRERFKFESQIYGRVGRSNNKVQGCLGCLGIIVLIFVLFVALTSGPSNKTSTNVQSAMSQESIMPGLTVGDIKVNLAKRWHMKFSNPYRGSVSWVYHGSATDPDTGVGLSCDIYAYNVDRIILLEFNTDGTGVMGTLPLKEYRAVTETYLRYGASTPFKGAQPDAAQAWVSNNLPHITTDAPAETMFSIVNFNLSGTQYLHSLELSPR